MADEVGQGHQRGRGVPWRPRGHRGGRARPPRGQGRFHGHRRQGQIEDNDAEDEVAEPVVAPPLRRCVHIGSAALDRMQQLSPEELLLHISNRVSKALCIEYLSF